jgi:hypothetical protein
VLDVLETERLVEKGREVDTEGAEATVGAAVLGQVPHQPGQGEAVPSQGVVRVRVRVRVRE